MNKSKLASQIKYKTEHTNMYFMHTITIIIEYHTNLILCWYNALDSDMHFHGTCSAEHAGEYD